MLLTVLDVISETAEAVTVVFDADLDYRPGQFLTLRIPSDRTGSVARCYSLSSSPHTDSHPAVTVKRTSSNGETGYGSHWVCDNVKPGDTVEVLPPSGVFTPHNLDDDLALYAAGSGITPIMSILKSALSTGNGKLALVYANRDTDSTIFATELDKLAAAHPDRLTVIHWRETERGLPTAEALAIDAAHFASHQAFLCGPGPFLDVVHDALSRLDVPRSRVHTEVFTSLTGDPFAEKTLGPGAHLDLDAEGAATVEVELDGEVHTLTWPRAASLVDIMLADGIDVPYSCQAGECGSCMCTLVEGEVTMDNPDLLAPEDIETGYILGCQAHPQTDRLRITF